MYSRFVTEAFPKPNPTILWHLKRAVLSKLRNVHLNHKFGSKHCFKRNAKFYNILRPWASRVNMQRKYILNIDLYYALKEEKSFFAKSGISSQNNHKKLKGSWVHTDRLSHLFTRNTWSWLLICSCPALTPNLLSFWQFTDQYSVIFLSF